MPTRQRAASNGSAVWSRPSRGPVVAIGGVAAASVRSVTETGAWGVAAVTALWDAQDPAGAAASVLEELVT
ncbi:MAG: thiamine phosphate synthase [Gemmatimonadales bacterium]